MKLPSMETSISEWNDHRKRKIREIFMATYQKLKSTHAIVPMDLKNCDKCLHSSLLDEEDKQRLLKKMGKRDLEVTVNGNVDFISDDNDVVVDAEATNVDVAFELQEKNSDVADEETATFVDSDHVFDLSGNNEDVTEATFFNPVDNRKPSTPLRRQLKRAIEKAAQSRRGKGLANAKKINIVSSSSVLSDPKRPKGKKGKIQAVKVGKFGKRRLRTVPESNSTTSSVMFQVEEETRRDKHAHFTDVPRKMPGASTDTQQAWKNEMKILYDSIFKEKFTSTTAEKEK